MLFYRYDLNPLYFKIDGSNLFMGELFSDSTEYLLIDPSVTGPTDILSENVKDSMKAISSLDFSATAATYLNTNWTSNSWSMSSFDSQLINWLRNNITDEEEESTNVVVMRGSVSGNNYTVVFCYFGSKGTLMGGTDGDLIVSSDTVLNLDTKDTYDFNSLDIQSGKTLTLTSSDGKWGVLFCVSCNIDGTLIYQNKNNGGTKTKTAPDGTSLSYTIVQNNGGAGASTWNTGVGGAQSNGAGGGGAGGEAHSYGNWAAGGAGKAPYLAGLSGNSAGGTPGSGGVSVSDINGNNGVGGSGSGVGGNGGSGSGGGGGGAAATQSGVGNYAGGGGGGAGGDKGKHGGGVYLKCFDTNGITGSGDIVASGENGYNGGNGGNGAAVEGGIYPAGAGGGGGGGAGAGGSGGKIVLKYFSTCTPTTSVLGGTGGTGGSGGSDDGDLSGNAPSGSNGQSGNTGTVQIL